MTWITPLLVSMSVAMMYTTLSVASEPLILKESFYPCSVAASRPSLTSAAMTLPSMTW